MEELILNSFEVNLPPTSYHFDEQFMEAVHRHALQYYQASWGAVLTMITERDSASHTISISSRDLLNISTKPVVLWNPNWNSFEPTKEDIKKHLEL